MRASLKWQKVFLLLTPSQSIVQHVAELKELVKELIGHEYEGYSSKAHISLLMESIGNPERFLYYVNDKVKSVTPFNLGVKNLNVFYHGEHGRTIYLEVVNKNPARDLCERITKKETDFIPHITIARNLSVKDFERVWPALQNLSYSNFFHCDHITVLKWNQDKWMHHLNIPFSNN